MTPAADEYAHVRQTRARHPEAIGQAARARSRRPVLGEDGRLLLIAADHPARASLGVGADPAAMASRTRLLDRLRIALARPGVDGVLATPDIVEDLLLLGALEDRVVIGSMNRGGLAGSVFESDDRFTAYDAAACARSGLDGGKMLCRIDPGDHATVATLHSCAAAVSELAAGGLMAMIEPFWAQRTGGALTVDLTPDAVIRSIAVTQSLGVTSAHSWLKIPVVADMERVMAATTLPTVLLGGEPTGDRSDTIARWRKALALPGVFGMVAGRALLFPEDGDVAAAVDLVVELVR